MAGTQPRQSGGGQGQHRQRGNYGGGSGLSPWIKLGIGSYLTFGLGTAVTLFLVMAFAPSDGSGVPATGSPFGTMGAGSSELFGAFAFGLVWLLFLTAGLATVLGIVIGLHADGGESVPVISAISNGAGAMISMFVILVLMILFAPSGADVGSAFGDLLGPILGLTIGAALTGAAAGALSENLRPR